MAGPGGSGKPTASLLRLFSCRFLPTFRDMFPTLAFGRRIPARIASSLLLGGALASSLGAQGTMVHTLEAFHAPTAAVALADGRTLLIANSGRGEYGLVAGRGSISRVTLGEDGHLKVDQLRMIPDLNGPVGMTLLKVAVGPLPAGTLVVTVGGSWVVDPSGNPLADDTARRTGLAFFDPVTGESRGRVATGEGSHVASALGHAVTDPTGIVTDAKGNLYLVEVDAATTRSSRRAQTNAGIVKISADALAALVRDTAPPANSLFHAPEYSIPTALVYSAAADSLFWTTYLGELREVPRGDMSGQTAVITHSKRLGTVQSLAETPRGDLFGFMADGMMVSIRGKRSREIKFRSHMRFLSPGNAAVVPAPDGKLWVILPEQGGGGVGPWRQRANVIAIPASL